MGIFNHKNNSGATSLPQTSDTLGLLPVVASSSHIIKSSEQYTKSIIDKPNWKLCICTVRMYQYRTSVVLHRDDIGSHYRAELWGDSPGSTSNWKYQYIGRVSLRQPTDATQITIRYEGAGYYTWGTSSTPSSWSSADNHSSYCIECFHVL